MKIEDVELYRIFIPFVDFNVIVTGFLLSYFCLITD